MPPDDDSRSIARNALGSLAIAFDSAGRGRAALESIAAGVALPTVTTVTTVTTCSTVTTCAAVTSLNQMAGYSTALDQFNSSAMAAQGLRARITVS